MKKIDIIIPAYKAQDTILRTISSIAMQTIIDEISIVIVNDNCPNGDYSRIIKMYSPYLDIREIKTEKNVGPGLARQYGIDNTNSQYFTCIDADDTFSSPVSLELLKSGLDAHECIMCCSGAFAQMGDKLEKTIAHRNDMVWMFGKMYRRDFIEKYNIHFNDTRANEDAGFNTWIRLLCNNHDEQIGYIDDIVYYWHNKKDSITRINDGQYHYDQCMCGWTDNMIYAIKNAKKIRPFDGNISRWTVEVMIQLYYYYIECYAKEPIFAEQEWEYVKKFYNMCYKKIEDDITDEAFSEVFSMSSIGSWNRGGLIGIIPHIGIKEFMTKLENEKYDENDIYEVWEKLPEYIIKNNEECGVCPKGYTKKLNNNHKEV